MYDSRLEIYSHVTLRWALMGQSLSAPLPNAPHAAPPLLLLLAASPRLQVRVRVNVVGYLALDLISITALLGYDSHPV